jgi:hypothetical protein
MVVAGEKGTPVLVLSTEGQLSEREGSAPMLPNLLQAQELLGEQGHKQQPLPPSTY